MVLVAVSSAFLVELFHLEYSGPFLVGHSFLVGLVVGLFGWLLAWGYGGSGECFLTNAR